VLRYLARYTHRVAISNGRLLSLEEGHVRFRWRDSRDANQIKEMSLDAVEFIRRFLLHVLPGGFVNPTLWLPLQPESRGNGAALPQTAAAFTSRASRGPHRGAPVPDLQDRPHASHPLSQRSSAGEHRCTPAGTTEFLVIDDDPA
jgi:hypothetical protein